MQDQIHDWWDRLTDEDLEDADGQPEQIIRRLQERYGCSYEEAEREFYTRIREANDAADE
jgi:hypothetical protein